MTEGKHTPDKVWKPMATAPTDVHVEMGRWDGLGGMNWRTTTGFAKRTRQRRFFGSYVEVTYNGEEYTHWRDIPEPPNDMEPSK